MAVRTGFESSIEKGDKVLNKIILLGRLTRDPDISTTPAGKIVTKFTLAVDRFGASKETDFINIVAWERLGENCGNSLSKGNRCLVEGRLQIRSFEGKDGQKRWVTEVVAQTVEFLDKKAAQPPADAPADASQFGKDIPEDELPY